MKHPRYLLSGLALSMLVASGGAQAAGLTSEHKPFGKTNDGTAVEQYVLRNSHGMQATVITYGGVLQSLKVPDKHGKVEDVVLGFDDVQGYQSGTAFFGATIGRFGNRLAGGAFELDGKRYQVPLNDGPNSLHGGAQGFDKHVWKATPVKAKEVYRVGRVEATDADVIQLAAGTPAFEVERIAYDSRGPFEYALSTMRADRYEIRSTLYV